MTNADNFMLPEEQANYIQQVMRTILTDPNPSILDVALLPILATDPRNGFSEETRKELMDEFIRFTGTQNNQDLLSEQMKQINMSHASMQECAKNARCNDRMAKVINIHQEYDLEGICFFDYGDCDNCGAQVQCGDKFCHECCARLEWE